MDENNPEFSHVYKTYHDRVWRCAAKLIGRDRADDVAQEVFVRINKHLETLKDPSKLSSWIYSITLNVVRDVVRKCAARKESTAMTTGDPEGEPEDAMLQIPDTKSRTPEEMVIRNEMMECYLTFVELLPPNYYEVYVLSEFEDLSNEEIAQRLSVSLDNVKIRLYRARTQLYDQLRRSCRCYYNERGEIMGDLK